MLMGEQLTAMGLGTLRVRSCEGTADVGADCANAVVGGGCLIAA